MMETSLFKFEMESKILSIGLFLFDKGSLSLIRAQGKKEKGKQKKRVKICK